MNKKESMKLPGMKPGSISLHSFPEIFFFFNYLEAFTVKLEEDEVV